MSFVRNQDSVWHDDDPRFAQHVMDLIEERSGKSNREGHQSLKLCIRCSPTLQGRDRRTLTSGIAYTG